MLQFLQRHFCKDLQLVLKFLSVPWEREFLIAGQTLSRALSKLGERIISGVSNVVISIRQCLHEYRSIDFLFTSFFAHFKCRDKRKEFAPNRAAYHPFGVDVFLSQRKIDHVAQFVELPVSDSSGTLPPILVVNVQVFPPFRMVAPS